MAVYGVEGPGWPLRKEWLDPQRREQILFAARSVETEERTVALYRLAASAAYPRLPAPTLWAAGTTYALFMPVLPRSVARRW